MSYGREKVGPVAHAVGILGTGALSWATYGGVEQFRRWAHDSASGLYEPGHRWAYFDRAEGFDGPDGFTMPWESFQDFMLEMGLGLEDAFILLLSFGIVCEAAIPLIGLGTLFAILVYTT